MQKSLPTVEISEGLDELLEIHVRNLSEKLSRAHTLEEIEAELATLNDLVCTYKRRDELLEKLLDTTTTEEKRRQIRAMFKTLREWRPDVIVPDIGMPNEDGYDLIHKILRVSGRGRRDDSGHCADWLRQPGGQKEIA